jgi:carbon monoxide dehydrogenase subunit G
MAEVRYTEHIDIAASPESVYAYRLDFDNLPAYVPAVGSDYKRTDGGREPGVGASCSFTSLTDYGEIPGTLAVAEADAPKKIVFDGDFGLKVRETMTFTPVEGGTRVDIEYVVTVPDDLDDSGRRFIEDSGRKPAKIELENMKRILET